MLAGRPPFTAPTAQALLAAQITQTPEPLAQLPAAPSRRRSTPLVMRCLEKRAADRWQSAAELVAQLEAMGTPSGGHNAGHGADAAISSGTEEAIRRWHPVRVALLFAAASLAVLAVVWLLVRQLGLPDWVLYGAIVLLLIGLPIMLVTGSSSGGARWPGRAAWSRRRRPRARAAGSPGAKRSAAASSRSPRSAVAAVVYTAMRLLGIGPVGTLVASGVLNERERLVRRRFREPDPDASLGLGHGGVPHRPGPVADGADAGPPRWATRSRG